MSPTSYQAAPPRLEIIAEAHHIVKFPASTASAELFAMNSRQALSAAPPPVPKKI